MLAVAGCGLRTIESAPSNAHVHLESDLGHDLLKRLDPDLDGVLFTPQPFRLRWTTATKGRTSPSPSPYKVAKELTVSLQTWQAPSQFSISTCESSN